jgi:hypothetical protein
MINGHFINKSIVEKRNTKCVMHAGCCETFGKRNKRPILWNCTVIEKGGWAEKGWKMEVD